MFKLSSRLPGIRHSEPNLHVEDAFAMPAWFCQQRSWIEDPCKSDSAIYNYPLSMRIRGLLNRQALERTLREFVQRHEVLRSVFRILDEELVQIVLPPQPLVVPLINLTKLDESAGEAQSRQFALEDAHRPFEPVSKPLLRASLLQLGSEDHILLLTTHHLVWDDWSTGVLNRELPILYEAFAAGQCSPLPELDFQYGDFVRWQWKWLEGETLESRLSFWKAMLADRNDFHHLATDHPRPRRRTQHGAREALTLDERLTTSLNVLSQRERVSLFMTLLAAFQCLLHLYSGHEDIALGSCAANRPLAEVEGLIGHFGNDLVLRTDLSGKPTFRELLGRVRKMALTAYTCQDLPFGQLVEQLGLVVDRSCNPLFQIMFILQDAPKENLQLPGLTVSEFIFDPKTAKYDLTVWLRIQDALEVSLEYNTDLFEAASMRRILDDYQNVLQTMVTDPGQLIGDLPVSANRMRSTERRKGM